MKNLKRIIVYLILIASLLLIAVNVFIGSCMGDKYSIDSKKIETEIKSKKRILYVYEFDSLTRKMEYELEIKVIDSMTIYKYHNRIDSTKNISFRLNKAKSDLYFVFDKFNVTDFNYYQTTSFKFDKYEMSDPVVDGVSPILFNKNYGILAWDNGWGNQFYFVADEINDEIMLPILWPRH
ncbi:hypothetical protein [Flavobacterium sp.]|uniref:hypothetical protein n=1 Tax=Flavobacterium sp. TaxID=239 RepID=UPI0037C096C9